MTRSGGNFSEASDSGFSDFEGVLSEAGGVPVFSLGLIDVGVGVAVGIGVGVSLDDDDLL